jgi:hypothetical protein
MNDFEVTLPSGSKRVMRQASPTFCRMRNIVAGCFAVSSIVLFVGGLITHEYIRGYFLREARYQAMQETMQRGERIITAINRYIQEKGKPPFTLRMLVPRYLRHLPDAGPMAYNIEGYVRGWAYKTGSAPDSKHFRLYVPVPGEYSLNLLTLGDIFIYQSDEQYSPYDFNGTMERVGKWSYYHNHGD